MHHSARTYVIGDIHGARKALDQCLEKASFSFEKDTLICLGDVCDGWPEVKESVDTLLRVKNLVYLMGNHDYWSREWMLRGDAPEIWNSQGGFATMRSYREGIPEDHLNLFNHARYYHEDAMNNLYVHGGFDPSLPIREQSEHDMIWDRSLVRRALQADGSNVKITPYNTVFVGHTPTINMGSIHPVRAAGICMLDTGAGWPGGVLTIMEVETGTFYQSEPVENLYPGAPSR